MTLLSVLFVMGVALLATMNFEADMIESQKQRARNEAGVEEVIDELGSLLRDTLTPGGDVPFGGPMESPFQDEAPTAPLAYAELRGVHHLFAAVEPNMLNQARALTGGMFLFPDATDVQGLTDMAKWTPPRDGGVDTSWPSGVVGRCDAGPLALDWCMTDDDCGGAACKPAGRCLDGPNQGAWCVTDEHCSTDQFNGKCGPERIPVDADGDGITDTFEAPVDDLENFGLQLDKLSAQLNPPSYPGGEVYLGLRVVPHGAMVNLNESHPNLIANVLNFYTDGNPP
ncbi:MAG: hypothetical protein PVI86_01360, partial [Phycisphaerae bacterium]